MSEVDRSCDLILEEHEALRQRMRELERYLDQPRPRAGSPEVEPWARALAGQFADLHLRVAAHFAMEEGESSLRELARSHPRATRAIASLLREHGNLLGRMKDLLTATRACAEGFAPEPAPPLRRIARALLKALRRHESRESELILQLFNEDIGNAVSGG